MIRTVVFLGGAILMALEIVGSRVLAPHFGSSIFVWGSLISIFLAALSIGYFWGGRLADRKPSLGVLGLLVGIPGIMIWLLPFYYPTVNAWVASLELGARFSPLLASVVLFAVPSIFLGTISPYAIRLEIESVETAGNTAGSLYALSTAGSIVGTLAASFFLIPMLGVRNIVHTLGLILVAMALAMWLMDRWAKSSGKASRGVALYSIAFLLAGGFLTPWEGEIPGVVYKKESLYHHIRVRDADSIRFLHFDNSFQSAVNLENPDELVFWYTRYLHLGRLYAPEARSALFVGLGGGSAPRSFHKDYPEMEIDVVEIDPEVVSVATKYFGFAEDERLRVHAVDGRLFVKQDGPAYDMAILDAYFAESIPFHLTTKEFLEEVKARLSPDGVVVANVIGAVSGPNSNLFRAMLRTYESVFPQVYVYLVRANGIVQDSLVRNIILVATMDEARLSREELYARADSFLRTGRLVHDVRPYLQSLIVDVIPTAGAPVLTDDYAPVDSLQHF